ncbi:hypothetical protein VNO78_18105 [Psophocarpus tetragonolobus]|uniref:Uncharacterized protein n=1 Tax=Psophocarpus tetragonolobus TaxID=3891 RepID=A0AAN9XL62_PSOTE
MDVGGGARPNAFVGSSGRKKANLVAAVTDGDNEGEEVFVANLDSEGEIHRLEPSLEVVHSNDAFPLLRSLTLTHSFLSF